jgi:NADH-quinone oxidoreductase subunit E
MLAEKEREEILAELRNAEVPRSACMEALKIVQQWRGFVSDEAIKDLAPLLGMTAEELEGIATFYSLIFRRPVGRHVILICDSVTCWVMGYEKILEYLKERLEIALGETTRDNRFTLLPVNCLGACDHAPALLIDGILYGDLDKQKLDQILEAHL